MSYTYTGDPTVNDVAWVRAEIGDTGPTYAGYGWVFTDEEIAAKIAELGSRALAAAALLKTWAQRLASQPDFQIGRFSESGRQAGAQVLNAKAAEILAQIASGSANAYAGGISVADKLANDQNTDRVQPAIKRGWMDNNS